MAHPELLAKIAQAKPNSSTTLDSAIQRYLTGESMQVLAKELSCSRRVLYKWMLSEVGQEQWADLKRDAMLNRIADADEMLENAHDPVLIARAREQARFARMDFERRFPKLYGPKHEVEKHSNITIVLNPQCDVTPYIDVQPAEITSTSEVIDNVKEDGTQE